MSSEAQPIIECINLSKSVPKPFSRRKIKIIDNISLAIPKGSTNIILGHNGAGKSTLLKSIMGLKIPDKGVIKFAGHTMGTLDRAKIGYMPESEAIPGMLTPLESLSFHAKVHVHNHNTSSKQRIRECLEKVGLYKHRNKLNRDLSKGMGRRLAWTIASYHKPSLLILDEPYSGLDPIGRMDMTGWIEELHNEGTSILICTHELDLIPAYADGVHILNQGKLIFNSPSPLPSRDTMLSYLKPISEDI